MPDLEKLKIASGTDELNNTLRKRESEKPKEMKDEKCTKYYILNNN